MPPQWNHVYAVFFPHAPVLMRVYCPMERWTSQESGSAIGDTFLERISEGASTGWFDGRIAPGRTADVICLPSADGCGPFAGARTGGDHHCGQSQDSHGSWLPPRAEDVDRTRLSSCLWSTRLPMTQMPTASSGGARISRRVVTHNHHRRDFESRLSDARRHFEALTCTPDDLLRHLGSPFASDNRSLPSQIQAA